MIFDFLLNFSEKIGFDFPSMIFFGEPKFPMPKAK